MDDLDRILADERVIRPSKGFTAGVMKAVHEQAAVPPPLEFPWSRFLPGLFTCIGLVFATFMVLGWTGGAGIGSDTQLWFDAIDTPFGQALVLAGAAILGSLAFAAMIFRSVGRGGTSPTI